jgi:hypothetical protein
MGNLDPVAPGRRVQGLSEEIVRLRLLAEERPREGSASNR